MHKGVTKWIIHTQKKQPTEKAHVATTVIVKLYNGFQTVKNIKIEKEGLNKG